MKTLWILMIAATLTGCSEREDEVQPSIPAASPGTNTTAQQSPPASGVKLEKITTRQDGKSEFTMEMDISDSPGEDSSE